MAGHTGKCRKEGSWTAKVTFDSDEMEFPVNGTVAVTCNEGTDPGPFNATCNMTKDYGAAWDISRVKCLRMCNPWAKQVDFSSAQAEFGVGATVLVSCQEPFEQKVFSITCQEMKSGKFEWDFSKNKCIWRCKLPKTWQARPAFSPKRQFYSRGEQVVLSCPEGYQPQPSEISCIPNGTQSTWSETPSCQGFCTKGGNWPPSVSAASSQTDFAVGQQVLVTCLQDRFEEGSFPMMCVEQNGRVEWDTSHVNCTEKCQKPTGDPYLRFAPDKLYYAREELVTLNCTKDHEPSQPMIRCLWNGSHSVWSEEATCQRKCQEPDSWNRRAEFTPKQSSYNPGDVVMWSCPEGYWPSVPQTTCTQWGTWSETVYCVEKCGEPVPGDDRAEFTPKQPSYRPEDSVTWSCPEGYRPSLANSTCMLSGSRSRWSRTAWSVGFCTLSGNWLQLMYTSSFPTECEVGQSVWVSCRQEQFEGGSGWLLCVDRAGRPEWDTSRMKCIEKCHRPQWDPRLQFVPDRPFYSRNEMVKLSCLDGSPPSLPEIYCARHAQDKQKVWAVRGGWSRWCHIEENVTCADSPNITTGTPLITPTSISLGWICTPSKSCLSISAMEVKCLPAGPQANPCWRPADSQGQTIGGQAGTLTCSNLQPFTLYNVTISARYGATRSSPSAVLDTQLLRTSETVPDQPQIEPRDPSTGSLQWKQLLSCHGDILGYQLNITAWRENDDRFLEEQVVQVNPSVTEYRPPHWRPGTNYSVTIQGLTAAGLGEASQWAFEMEMSGKQESSPVGITPGYVAIAVVMPLVVAAGALLLWVVLSRSVWGTSSACSAHP
ncbi:complement receptor type 1-like [Alligator mississippiensis]|uniref:complement receptor type 1-like n=1 Tax=Alligator mississippiensis TaxID=8496 RepID=UPI0028774FE7|nr:complement receptor type 1-like [Alligator mississippiensis]